MRRQSNSAKPTSSRPELFLTLEAYRRHTRYPYHLRIAVMSRSITFVTGNANKLREVKAILSQGGSPLDVVSQAVDAPEIQGTTQEIARYKASAAAEAIGGPCITEDTALCFSALGGLPGPYIRTFLDTLGHDGLNAMLRGFDDKRAHALCTFAFCAGPGQTPEVFEGRCEGRIVPARGPSNFGWDPVFEVEGAGKTFAEMTSEEKNAISHRSRALAKLREFLQARAG